MNEVNVFSLGRSWGLYPGAPGPDTLQQVVDVRGVIADPYDQFSGIDGLNPSVQLFIINHPGFSDWLENQKKQIQRWIKEMESQPEFETLNIYFTCAGGFQRSVVVVEIIVAWLEECYHNKLIITKQHLTLELSRKKLQVQPVEK